MIIFQIYVLIKVSAYTKYIYIYIENNKNNENRKQKNAKQN